MTNACRVCGRDNDSAATHCHACGALLAPIPPWPVPAPPPPAPPAPPAPPIGAPAGDVDWSVPPYPSAPPPRRRRGGRIAIAVVLVLVLAGAGSWYFVLRDDGGPDFPDEWDPRVADVVDFIERERGLDFEHPVEVEFLTEDAFRDRVESDEAELTDEERQQVVHAAEYFRSLGLAEGEFDLLELLNQLRGETTLAFYDLEAKQIVVRGTELDVDRRVTLVHEMTHALQDQHFDIKEVQAAGEENQSSAPTALYEGDASAVEDAYVEQLSSAEQREYEDAQGEFGEEVDVEDVPVALQIGQSAPYDFGPILVQLLKADGGNRRLDEAYADPPDAEEYFVDPVAYLEGDEFTLLDTPDLPAGTTEVFDGGEFGVLAWYMMLSERIDAHDALHAVDGWDGDHYLVFRRDGTTCTRLAFEAEDRAARDTMLDAIDEWIEEFDAAGASVVERTGEGFLLETCDPGPESRHVTDRIEQTYILPVARAQFTAVLTEVPDFDLDPSEARCVARAIVDGLTLAELSDPDGEVFATDEYRRLLLDALADCS